MSFFRRREPMNSKRSRQIVRRASAMALALIAALTCAAAARAAGELGMVKRCTGSWCRIAGPGFDGWVVQEQLWGVYPNEKVE